MSGNEITPEKIRALLALDLGDNDSGERTVRGYLLRLLRDVWTRGESFDGKRPFGNSGWDYDIKTPMVVAGFVDGHLDDDGYIERIDDRAADELVLAAIAALGQPAAATAPPRTVVVDIPLGRGIDRMTYRADRWTSDGGTLTITRDGTRVGEHSPLGWLSARDGDALAPDYAARALAAAKRALTEIAAASKDVSEPFGRPEIRAIAQRGLDEIFAEVEL